MPKIEVDLRQIYSLNIYFYGYFNGLLSSRKLERQCTWNVESHWLIGKRAANHPKSRLGKQNTFFIE